MVTRGAGACFQYFSHAHPKGVSPVFFHFFRTSYMRAHSVKNNQISPHFSEKNRPLLFFYDIFGKSEPIFVIFFTVKFGKDLQRKLELKLLHALKSVFAIPCKKYNSKQLCIHISENNNASWQAACVSSIFICSSIFSS